MRYSLLACLFLSVALTASASAQSFFRKKIAEPATAPAVPVRPATAVAAQAAATVPTESGTGNAVYRPGDTIEMRISGIPAEDAAEFPSPLTIGADGNLNITYIGEVRAVGLSQGDLEKIIKKRLIDEKIFRWPSITITTINGMRSVTIGGQVRGPSRQAWTADLTLMSLISAAGGPSEFASDKVNIIRNGTVTQYKMKLLKKNPANDPKLLPGDQVDVQ